MKTLTVYIKDSFEKFPGLFQDYSYHIDEISGILKISRINLGHSHCEMDWAAFKEWDYFRIEEEFFDDE